ncbi:3-phosphoshikimate 1-carboxyvinyltransferase [Cuniculiplasma sp. SKW3]|uniref:3-phosphoshikimate 1-carboxyvinyltransferase n=1 Tax=unclassified Cuniculiplasma TaxID=2619706 RepID=UPI003FD2CD1E
MGKKMIHVTFSKIGGEVVAPPSKSFMQRYVLLSSFIDGTMIIHNPGYSDDDLVSLSIGKNCGKIITQNEDEISISGKFKNPHIIDVGESGTSFRLVQGLLASTHSRTEILLKKSLIGRPMDPLISALSSHGYIYSKGSNSVTIDAFHFKCPESFTIDGTVSSQFISSLMFCLALSRKENGTVNVRNGISSEGYISITGQILEDFGCHVNLGNEILVNSKDLRMPKIVHIEGDYSSSAFLIVIGLLLSDEGITVKNLPAKSMQPDMEILKILEKYLTIRRHENTLDVTASKRDVGRISVDVKRIPDLAPPLSVLGMFSKEGVEIKNPERLRTKESDRLEAIIDLAKATGAVIESEEDAIIIRRGNSKVIGDLPERKDHRIVMAKFIASSMIDDRFQINFHRSVNKSFPEFWKYCERLGFKIDFK